jgi:hypothetical protein
VSVYFSDNTGVCDVIEFSVYDGGKAVASKDEIVQWFRETLEDIEKRRRTQLQDESEGRHH